MLGKKVASVDVNEKEVILESGEKVHFTRLIYALGSECFIPPIEGSSLPEVVAIRRLADGCDRRRCAWSGSCLGTEKSGD